MKKWKLKLMKEAAAKLPQGKQMVKRLGADMLKDNPLMKLPNGDAIDPKKYYMTPVDKSNYGNDYPDRPKSDSRYPFFNF